MTEEIINIPEEVIPEETQSEGLMASLSKHRGTEELAFAFLLALTPLVVLTFFGQVGLI